MLPGTDLCTADLCYDFVRGKERTSATFQPNGRNLAFVSPTSKNSSHGGSGGAGGGNFTHDLIAACERTPACGGFSVGSSARAAPGGWLKGGSINEAETQAVPASNLLIRIGGQVTRSCSVYVKQSGRQH